jgi:hypothetical protein
MLNRWPVWYLTLEENQVSPRQLLQFPRWRELATFSTKETYGFTVYGALESLYSITAIDLLADLPVEVLRAIGATQGISLCWRVR